MKKLFTLIILALGNIAMAQTACDSLDINVKYYPFNDTIIQVDVYNNGNASFGYPIFTILDNNGDSVAIETLNFFGISQGSSHILNVFPGALPGNTFSGTLTLYYQTIDSYSVCAWPMNFDLCPDTCYTVYPYMINMGSAQILGEADWNILNANSQVVASGTFTMDTNNQYVMDSVCLDAGSYSLKVKDISLTPGGNKHIGFNSTFMNVQNPDTVFNNVDSTSLGFEFFSACAPTTSVNSKAKVAGASIYSFANNIYINSQDALGNIAVYSMDGRKVYSSNTQSATHTINLSNFASGIYIVRVGNKNGMTVRKVYIEQ